MFLSYEKEKKYHFCGSKNLSGFVKTFCFGSMHVSHCIRKFNKMLFDENLWLLLPTIYIFMEK